MKRQPRYLFFAATVALSWLAMQAVHEFGHVSAALVSGGHVERVILHPAAFSYTQLSRNPHPNFVTWMGPIVGTLLPAVVLQFARLLHWRGWFVLQFFAGFCLIANGTYIVFGSLGNVGDAGDLLRHDSPIYLLWMFGAITIPIGLWLWNGLGPHFGFGPNASPPDPAVRYVVTALLVIVVMLELLLSAREVVASSKLPKGVAAFPQYTRCENEDCRHEKEQNALVHSDGEEHVSLTKTNWAETGDQVCAPAQENGPKQTAGQRQDHGPTRPQKR